MRDKNSITGGAGVAGSNIAFVLKKDDPENSITAFENTRRSGSELNFVRSGAAGVQCVGGDTNCPADLQLDRDGAPCARMIRTGVTVGC